MIRPATTADLTAIEALVEAAYSPYIPRMGQKPGPMLDNYAAHIGNGHTHVLEIADDIAGVIVLVPKADSMLLDNVAVSPAHRGQGHGATLLRFAEATARAACLPSITLYTHVTMTENIALYQRIGYVETHRATEAGLHRVYMSKTLP